MKPPSNVTRNVKDEWKKVGAHFRELGDKLRSHYEGSGPPASAQEGSETPDAARADAPPADDDAPAAPASAADPLKEVVDRLADAVDRIADAVRDAAKDPSVKEDAGAVTGSLIDALAATFDEIGDEFRIVVEKARARRDPASPSADTEDHAEDSAGDGSDPDGSDDEQ